MLALLVALSAIASPEPVQAGPGVEPGDAPRAWSALRVTTDCQSGGRTRACTFLRGFIDHSPVLTYVPRAEAQVVIYVNATARTNDDEVLLRFVSELPNAPTSFEVLSTLNTRVDDDQQRAALEPAFLRGIAPFVTAVNPAAVQVTLAAPPDTAEVEPQTTPWGAGIYAGGWGSWTEDYQDLSVWDGLYVYRVTSRSRFYGELGHSGSITRQPALEVDGQEISLDSASSTVSGSSFYGLNLDDHWTVGGVVRGGHEDPEGQYLGTARAHAAVERNWFPSDDPRGNRLAATYILGMQADRYNQVNMLGQEEAFFPSHGVMVRGSVRVDTLSFSLQLGASADLVRPWERYVLSSSGSSDLKLGDHVDLTLNGSLTKQAIPGPAEIDTSSYEAITQSDYAEPLSLYGYLSLRLHWDHTNGQRNNRFDALDALSGTSNL